MSKTEKAKNFKPDTPRRRNGHFMGLPHSEAEAEVVLLSAPWSSGGALHSGLHTAAANILESSHLLSLYDPDVPEAWKKGIFLRLPDEQMVERGRQFMEKTAAMSLFTENGESASEGPYRQVSLEGIDKESAALNSWLRQEAAALLDQKKRVALIGGDSGAQLGLIEALAERHHEFGIIHLGARMGLRPSAAGLAHAPEGIFTNALKLKSITRLALAGISAASPAEEQTAEGREDISVFYQHEIRRRLFRGHTFSQVCGDIIRGLPDQVYLSFDIGALLPQYRPNAGQAIAGGFEFEEALYLVKRMVDAELEVIGFGLCGIAGLGHSYDGQVGAQLAYRLANLMGASGGGGY